MTEDRWARVKALFQATVERPEPERAAFLAAAAGGDESLRRDVESLVRSDDCEAALTRFVQLANAGLHDSGIDPDTPPPANIGPYRVVGLLGMGGMGEVFRARDAELNRDVALKLLPGTFASDVDRLSRFRREARALASLNHPHVGAIYGLEDADGRQALVLELVEGVTLAERIASGPLPERAALTLARQIALALEAAHDKGIVHRDLKPANIKVTPAGVVKVLDFGLAKTTAAENGAGGEAVYASSAACDDTRAGAILGTAAYMSPEQARGIDVDTRADIWAFGCILFEMLSGRKAFAADAESGSTEKVLGCEPDWTALPTRTASTIRRLVRACLEKDPDRRPRTITQARHIVDGSLTKGRYTGRAAMAAGAAVLLITAAASYVWSRPSELAGMAGWVQLTRLPDSATQPALSPDGRTLAFIRGRGSRLASAGQIYVKSLPDGEPVPLTRDALQKMSPVFSPDGNRIAYTTSVGWDTWVVPVLRGEPYRWLRNASGLTWIGAGEILFSETRAGHRHSGMNNQMGIVTSEEGRSDSRTIYWPSPPVGMAHRSYRSPDGRWVLIAEMDGPGTFLSCRLVPFDGSSTGRVVGPSPANCTYAGWSPDGRWMYFSADAGDGSHLWRQAFPEGTVQQVTHGPTEQEGLAVSADGRSLVTSVGLRQQAVWLHDAAGERQLSGEGYAFAPLLSASGQQVCYLVTDRVGEAGATRAMGAELRMTDVKTGRTTRLLPGQMVLGFDLSHDGRIAASVLERDGTKQVWLASIDGRIAPRRVPLAMGDEPRFGPAGEIVFRASKGTPRALWRIGEDGSGLQQLTIGTNVGAASPDGRWISAASGDTWLVSLTGAKPLLIFPEGDWRLRWAPDGRRLYLSRHLNGRTYVLPLSNGAILPRIPAGGLTDAAIAASPGVRLIPHGDVGPGPSPDIYTFVRETVTRNIYRIPIK